MSVYQQFHQNDNEITENRVNKIIEKWETSYLRTAIAQE